jgi:hypothetical protein
MRRSNFPSRTLGWLAILTGIVGLSALLFLILFFSVGGPFGTLNDICNGLTGLLSAGLAWSLYRRLDIGPRLLVLPWLGALTVALGSRLIISGWYLAGLYTSAGYALIGLWLFAINYSERQTIPLPRGLINLGLIAGMIMALGVLTIPGIIQRIDAWEAGPWYINYVGQLGSIGYLLLYPIWCVLVGRYFLRSQKQIVASAQE